MFVVFLALRCIRKEAVDAGEGPDALGSGESCSISSRAPVIARCT